MRTSVLGLLLGALLAAPTLGAPPVVPEAAIGVPQPESLVLENEAAQPALRDSQLASEDEQTSSSTFNGMQVPPMKELKGQTFEDEIKDGYWCGLSYHSQNIPSIWSELILRAGSSSFIPLIAHIVKT